MDFSSLARPRRTVALPALALLLAVSASAQTQPPAADPGALVHRAVNNYLAQLAAHHPDRFFFHKHDEARDFTQEIMETAQGDVALTLAGGGKPLSPANHQIQIDRLNNLAAHPSLQVHRQQREQEDSARIEKLLRLLPDAFVYRYDSVIPCVVTVPPTIPLPGEPLPPPPAAPVPPAQCYRLIFTPKPDWNPPDAESRVFSGMSGELWIEQSQERLVRLSARLISDVDFGWGIVGRLNKGGTIFLEQTQFPGGDWELSRMNLNLTGKILLIKAVSFRMTEEMTGYSPLPPNLDYRKAIQMLESGHDPPAR